MYKKNDVCPTRLGSLCAEAGACRWLCPSSSRLCWWRRSPKSTPPTNPEYQSRNADLLACLVLRLINLSVSTQFPTIYKFIQTIPVGGCPQSGMIGVWTVNPMASIPFLDGSYNMFAHKLLMYCWPSLQLRLSCFPLCPSLFSLPFFSFRLLSSCACPFVPEFPPSQLSYLSLPFYLSSLSSSFSCPQSGGTTTLVLKWLFQAKRKNMMRAKARYITGCVNTAWWEVLCMQHMFTMYIL